MSKNKGLFTVIQRKDKYVIVYIENGIPVYLDKYSYDTLPEANNVLKNQREEVNTFVSDMKAEEARKEAERIAAEKAKQEEKKRKQEEKRKEFWSKGWVKFTSGVVAAALVLTGGHFAGVGISNLVDKGKKTSTSQHGSVNPTETTAPVETTVPTETTVSNGTIGPDVNEIKGKDEKLSQENFEKLVVEYTKMYTDKNIDLTTEDVIKFVSIINIEELLEENPEFASELFGTQDVHAYLDDAMDVIAATYGYNYMTYEKEQSTKNFIRISDSIYGEQKEKMLVVENYVDLIDEAKGDAEKINQLVDEMLVRLESGDLTNLDSGVRFGMITYIELIRSYFAKDVLTSRNFDRLTVISETHLNNIKAMYTDCASNNYTMSADTSMQYTDDYVSSYTKGLRM